MNARNYHVAATEIDRDATADTLRHLIEICKDGEHGFKTAADDAKDGELKVLFLRYSKQRASFVRELEAHVVDLGCDAKESGSVSGSLHRGWFNLRAALTSNEPHAVLAECERGEDSAVAAYREALEKLTDAASRDLVSRQFTTVLATHDDVRARRDRAIASSKN